MPETQHPFDSIADELVDWIQRETPYYVEAMKGGNAAPFGASGNTTISEQQKLDYYRRKMFVQNPDGSIDYTKPNNAERDKLMARLGVDGYAHVATAVMPVRTSAYDMQHDAQTEYNPVEESATVQRTQMPQGTQGIRGDGGGY